MNDENKVLFVKEKHPYRKQVWKFPGGYVEQGEELYSAAEREVFEETGIKAKFVSLLLFRQIHKFAFDCSDMYFVCLLQAINKDITKCSNEIDFCEWANIEDIQDELSPFNRHCLEEYKKYKKDPKPFVAKEVLTPYLQVPKVTIYAPE